MAAPSSELQKAIYDRLVADASVHGHVADRIFDRMPEDGDYPCVTFGATDEITADHEEIPGQELNVTLHVWSREHGRLRPCKDIVWAVRSALHDATLTIADPIIALAFIRVTATQTFTDADGITAHGVVQVRAVVEH